jgi:hypothetical protein
MLCAQISPTVGHIPPEEKYVMGVANRARSETFAQQSSHHVRPGLLTAAAKGSETFAQQETYVTSSFGRKSTRFK